MWCCLYGSHELPPVSQYSTSASHQEGGGGNKILEKNKTEIFQVKSAYEVIIHFQGCSSLRNIGLCIYACRN